MPAGFDGSHLTQELAFFVNLEILYTIFFSGPLKKNATEVHLCMRSFRQRQGNCHSLDVLQRRHQQLFSTFYPEHCRPKHHYRMHLPSQYNNLMYMDAWCLEKKHKRYKQMLANSLGHLWKERSGLASQEIAARVLHMTVMDLRKETWKEGLSGKIYSQEEVLASAGIHGRLSSKFVSNGLTLQSGDVLFWDDSRQGIRMFGLLDFFIDREGDHVIVFERLLELPSPSTLPFTLKLTKSETTDARHWKLMSNVQHPAWWCIDGPQILCLL